MSTATLSPVIGENEVVFALADPSSDLAGVNLYQEVLRPRNGPAFTRRPDDAAWQLRFPRADLDRMEYLVELVRGDGSAELRPDPSNPLRAPGPFGDKSVVEWPEYGSPAWLEGDFRHPGPIVAGTIDCRSIGASLPVVLWSSPGTSPDQPLPLLIAHDGPDYAEYSKLLMLLDRKCSEDLLPPLRAALIGPVDRNEIYSASAAYGRVLAHRILPWLNRHAPTPQGRRFRIGMGASLGALSMLHAHRTHPASFGALYLQSGSFFRQRFDKQESGFVRFRRISRFVGRILTAGDWSHPVPVTMTCGTIEENLANNHAVHDALARQGYDVRLAVNRDGHNWVGWRDTFDPHLIELLQRVWGQ
ncbi:MAG: alpha/beta hydrolase [Actinomycetota bacterium]